MGNYDYTKKLVDKTHVVVVIISFLCQRQKVSFNGFSGLTDRSTGC